MTGVAAGLASEGYHVFTYSIANFPTLRCLEQIRNDICYHALPVTVVSVGAGMAYGNLGYSHHAVQDIGIMRTLAESTILSPSYLGETRYSGSGSPPIPAHPTSASAKQASRTCTRFVELRAGRWKLSKAVRTSHLSAPVPF